MNLSYRSRNDDENENNVANNCRINKNKVTIRQFDYMAKIIASTAADKNPLDTKVKIFE